jgi:hypothetical protein
MMRIRTAARSAALAGVMTAAFSLAATPTWAQTASPGIKLAQASPPVATDASGPARVRRPLRRLPIYPRYQQEPDDGVYPRYNPGPNAVRDCTATYVQEYRPSGTVIVPRMNCFWRRG